MGSDILFFLALGLSKLSATTTVWTMSPLSHKKLLPVLLLIGGWALSAVFARAFACSFPKTWDYLDGQCINMVSIVSPFWSISDFLGCVLDLCLCSQRFDRPCNYCRHSRDTHTSPNATRYQSDDRWRFRISHSVSPSQKEIIQCIY